MKYGIIIASLLFCIPALGQSHADSIQRHREHYKQEFLTDSNSPLKASDTGYLRFFPPDVAYWVVARFKLTPDTEPFQLPTSSGKTKTYRKYGEAHFKLFGRSYQLDVYQSPDLMKREELKDHLFVPFKDLTNYETTYGGGRYIDLSLQDIVNNTVIIDFNKAYNPYCAFAGGYSCPIPPEANHLRVQIKAGEKQYGKEPVAE